MAPKALAISVFVLISFLWGSFIPITKHALDRYDPFVFSLFESAVLLPISIAALIWWRRDITVHVLTRGLLTGVLLASALLIGTLSVNFTTATNATFLGSLDVLFATLIALVCFKKRCGLSTVSAVIMSTLGAYLVISQSNFSGGSLIGDSLAIVACMLYVAFLYLAQYDACTDENPAAVWPRMSVEFTVVAVSMMITSYVFSDWSHYSPQWPQDVLLFAYVGILTSLVPLVLCVIYIRHISVITAGCILMLEPVWAVMLSVVYLNELLTIAAYVGGLMIIVAAITKIVDEHLHQPRIILTVDRYRRRAAARKQFPHLAFAKWMRWERATR